MTLSIYEEDPIPFQVRVSWTGGEGEEIQPLYYCTEIIGAKTHDIVVVSPDKCIGTYVCMYVNTLLI